jgi:4-amino-4-deoxy-L-arabinose transferase-like glycosyltransferase
VAAVSFGAPKKYSYFLVPVTAIGGLNQFTTRLPSAVFGSLGIIVIFSLTSRMFGKSAGLAAASLLAINPWAIQFSRGAWEANVNLVMVCIGVTLFMSKKYLRSFLFIGLTLWTYQSSKLFTPLLFISMLLVYREQFNIKTNWIKLSLLLIFIFPVIFSWASQSGRLKVYSVFSYTRSNNDVNEILSQDKTNNYGLTYYLFHSEKLDQLRGIYSRYLNHYSPQFLFITGDWTNFRHAIPYYGYFHIVEIVSMVLGLIWISRNFDRNSKFLLLWLIIAPIPSALSRDVVSGVRSIGLLVPLLMLSAIGVTKLWQRKYLRIVYVLVTLFLVVYYCDLYFIHTPRFTAVDWLYPYKGAVGLVGKNINDYKNVVFTQKLGQPYIFVLYYLKIDPRTYQSSSSLSEDLQGDVGMVNRYAQFEFRPIDWRDDRKLKSTLFVGGQYELPEQDLTTVENLVRIGDVKYPSGDIGPQLIVKVKVISNSAYPPK